MNLKLKLKLIIVGVLLIIGGLAYAVLSIEAVQKKVFDIKADLVGTHRVVQFYSPLDGKLLSSYTDRDMRFEETPNGVSVWLGSTSKKVHSNLPYIIEDK